MSYTQLVKYLNSMIDLGFIEEQHIPFRAFRIKKNGKIFMDLMKKNGVDYHEGVDNHDVDNHTEKKLSRLENKK